MGASMERVIDDCLENRSVNIGSPVSIKHTRPPGCKTFFVLNSAEHEISTGY